MSACKKHCRTPVEVLPSATSFTSTPGRRFWGRVALDSSNSELQNSFCVSFNGNTLLAMNVSYCRLPHACALFYKGCYFNMKR